MRADSIFIILLLDFSKLLTDYFRSVRFRLGILRRGNNRQNRPPGFLLLGEKVRMRADFIFVIILGLCYGTRTTSAPSIPLRGLRRPADLLIHPGFMQFLSGTLRSVISGNPSVTAGLFCGAIPCSSGLPGRTR